MRETLPGEPPIELQVRHASRARRISLRVSGRDGRVTLTVPPGASVSEAVGFARDRENWLRRVLAEMPQAERPQAGGTLLVEGRTLPVVGASVHRVTLAADALHVPEGRAAGPLLARFLKNLARQRADVAVALHAHKIERPAPPLTLKDTRSRWGSCTAEGKVMLSWRLVMAPPQVLTYVAAHEVAHLVHLDHSPRFWALTERLCPDWRAARAWLRREGARLQSVDFS